MTVALPLANLHPSPDYVSDVIRRTADWYEPAILRMLDRRLPESGTIVDAGAMIGNHTRYLALARPSAVVHAFEPYPLNHELLERNTADLANVVLHREALSDHEGSIDLHCPWEDNLGAVSAVAPPDYLGTTFARPCVTLDSVGLADVVLLKVDVERHEPQVLAGARDTITRWRPVIVIEDWEHWMPAIMAGLGYRLAVDWGWEHQTYLYEPA